MSALLCWLAKPVQQTLFASFQRYERVFLHIFITLWQVSANMRSTIFRHTSVYKICQFLIVHGPNTVGIGLRRLKCPTFDHNFIRFSVVPAICNASIAKIKSHLYFHPLPLEDSAVASNIKSSVRLSQDRPTANEGFGQSRNMRRLL